VLAFVHERGAAHPRELEQHLGAGTETNYWGGSSRTTTRLLDSLHYRGQLRVVRREAGIRVYAPAKLAPRAATAEREHERENLDLLVDLAVRKYAPMPAASLASLIGRLRYAAPQWTGELRKAVTRAKERLATAQVGGIDWFWPAEEQLVSTGARGSGERARRDGERVRLLSPFDPVVWDRRRFELFWGWAYRFEAYTPAAKRKLGYYALPLLWREQIIGWANLSLGADGLDARFGYVAGKPPREPAFAAALEAELARFERFLSPRANTASRSSARSTRR
jgi:uncharacterized protein YcaQ